MQREVHLTWGPFPKPHVSQQAPKVPWQQEDPKQSPELLPALCPYPCSHPAPCASQGPERQR